MSEQPWPDEELMVTTTPTSSERTQAVLAHVGGLITGFLVPLIFMLTEKKEGFLRWHSRESLNFQIFLTFPYVLSGLIVAFVCLDWTFLVAGLLLMAATVIYEISVIIFACVAAYHGRLFHYPVTFRFVPDPAESVVP